MEKSQKELNFTPKTFEIAKALANQPNGVTAVELITINKEDFAKKGINTDKPNSVNATLAYLALLELVEKTKVAKGDKIVTSYKPNDRFFEELEKQIKKRG